MFHELARDDVFRLETRRLWLRWPHAAEAADLVELAGDWEVARKTASIPHPYRPDDAAHFIRESRAENSRGKALRLAVTLKGAARNLVGVVGVEDDDGIPSLGYWLGRPFWGRGYAGEAAHAVIDAFFRLTRAEELQALALEENAASRGVLEKVGFTEVARLKSGPGRQAENPTLRLALRRRDWQAREDASLRAGLRSVTA